MIKQKLEGVECKQTKLSMDYSIGKMQVCEHYEYFIKNKIPNTNYTHFSLLYEYRTDVDLETYYEAKKIREVKYCVVFDRFAEIVISNKEHVRDGVLEIGFEDEESLYVLHFSHLYAPSNPIFDRFEFKVTKKSKVNSKLPRTTSFKKSLTRRGSYYSKIEEELKGIM